MSTWIRMPQIQLLIDKLNGSGQNKIFLGTKRSKICNCYIIGIKHYTWPARSSGQHTSSLMENFIAMINKNIKWNKIMWNENNINNLYKHKLSVKQCGCLELFVKSSPKHNVKKKKNHHRKLNCITSWQHLIASHTNRNSYLNHTLRVSNCI